MQYKLYDLLSPDVCDTIVAELKTSDDWQDGKLTTGDGIAHLKNNNELLQGEVYDHFIRIWNEAIGSRDNQRKIYLDTMYNLVLTPMLNRYNVGEGYGWHFDQPYLNPGGRPTLMSFSYTVFLNDDYEGGELQIEDQLIKGKKGQLLVYKNHLRHRVTTVTKGTRYAGIGWMTSLIRNDKAREHIAMIEKCTYDPNLDLDSPVVIALQKVHSFLYNQFGE